MGRVDDVIFQNVVVVEEKPDGVEFVPFEKVEIPAEAVRSVRDKCKRTFPRQSSPFDIVFLESTRWPVERLRSKPASSNDHVRNSATEKLGAVE